MRRSMIRLVVLGLAIILMLGAVAACGGDEPEPEPTADIQATIDAAVQAATPTETPTPEPTNTPEPTPEPTPNIAATVAAAIAAAAPPTAVPAPVPTATPVPAEPTATPAPTNTPVPTHTPTPLPEQSSGPPCIIAGTVKFGNSLAPAGIPVFARSQTGDVIVETQTNEDGEYVLTITNFDLRFDLFVAGNDTNQDTPITSRGCRVIRNLSP